MCLVAFELVVGLSHAYFGTLDILMTDSPDQWVGVAVLAPIGALSAFISIAEAVSNLCVSRKVLLCGAIQDLPSRNIWSADQMSADQMFFSV